MALLPQGRRDRSPADQAIDLLKRVTAEHRQSPLRNGQLINFPVQGELFVAGDLHNHVRNYQKFKKVAALHVVPDRHVLLQEVIHGGSLGPNGEDNSFTMLLDALKWAEEFPGRVHFILANHDLSQVQRTPIMKDGYDLTDRFTRYLNLTYRERAEDVIAAHREFVYNLPLGGITATGILFTHSLPGPKEMDKFDRTILSRPLTRLDYERGGPAYNLVWGRFQKPDALIELSRAWWADMFVCGHQQQEAGFGTRPPNMLILDSCHNHGVFLPIVLSRQYTFADLEKSVVPLAAVA